jgi:hypothetical protein
LVDEIEIVKKAVDIVALNGEICQVCGLYIFVLEQRKIRLFYSLQRDVVKFHKTFLNFNQRLEKVRKIIYVMV